MLATPPTNPLLFGDDAAGDAVTGVSGGIGLHVVGLGVDNKRRSAVAENGVAVSSPIHIFVDDLRLGLAIGIHSEILHIAGVMTLGILKSVLLVVRVEMGAGRLEIWGIALCILVDVNGMLSRRQIVQGELDHHALALVQERRTYALALGILQFDCNFGGARQGESAKSQEQNGDNERVSFHAGYYSAKRMTCPRNGGDSH